MCYEFWRDQQKRAQDEEVKKRVQDMIEKAKTAPVAPRPSRKETDKETVPA